MTRDEALVLFEWLSDKQPSESQSNVSEAEMTVAWRLEGALERLLEEPFARDYGAIVEKARERVLQSAPDA